MEQRPQSKTTQKEQLFVVCLIDSALAMLPEWVPLVHDYIHPLVARLVQNYTDRSVCCVAFLLLDIAAYS